MKNYSENIKKEAIKLREDGKTFNEITNIIGFKIPKSTLSYWCKEVKLPDDYEIRVKKIMVNHLEEARSRALEVNRIKRKKHLDDIRGSVHGLQKLIKNKDVAKIALAVLYLGEGGKTEQGKLYFGNSNPLVIDFFLNLFRFCYQVDEKKFRCTVQCRADQNVKDLKKFWSKITKIPLKQFYKTQVDLRTIGKKSRKKDYKGVCRLDYFSADIFLELKYIVEIIIEGL